MNAFWIALLSVACLMVANILLAALHLIPGFPLDGGRILRAILWDRWNDLARATRVVSRIGNGLAVFFMIFGLIQFISAIIQSLVGQSYFAGLLFMVGLFMKQSARALATRRGYAQDGANRGTMDHLPSHGHGQQAWRSGLSARG